MGIGAHELREQRHGLSLGDERKAQDGIVRAVTDVGVECPELAAGSVGHVLPGSSPMAGRPGLAGELAQRHRASVTSRCRMVFGEYDVDGVAAQILALDACGSRMRLLLPFVGEDEVDVAERERGQRFLRLRFDELAAKGGRVTCKRLHRGNRETERNGLEGGDASPPRNPTRRRSQLGLRQLGALEQRACVADEDERGIGQPHPSPGPFEERDARLALEHPELLRDGRRREPQRVGHGGDRPARVQLVQEAQPVEVEHSQVTLLNSHHEYELFLHRRRQQDRCMPSTGTLYCLASAAAFGAMGVVGKLAYDEGATVGTLLATRFALAAALFWLLLIWSGRAGELRRLARRDVGIAIGLGAVGYGAQAGCAFAALDRLDASLFALLLYVYPVLVTVAAIGLGRESASLRTSGALVLASSGLILVLAGAAMGAVDVLGTMLALTAAVVYSAYILTSHGVAARLGPLVLSTLLCTGAATTLTLAGLAAGDVDPGRVSATGFAWLGGLAVVSTVGAITLFFAGLRRVGPTAASILSTLEPVVTVALAFAVFGKSLGPAQLAGGALVLSAVLAVRVPTARIEKEAT